MFHIFPCQPHRFFGHGGRKEEKLPLFRRFIHQSFDIFPETIGQHLIRLIQDYRFHLGKVQTFPPDMVQKAAGCTDNDLGIPFQLLQLVSMVLPPMISTPSRPSFRAKGRNTSNTCLESSRVGS